MSSQPNDLLVPQNMAKQKKIAKWIVDQIAQDFPVTAFASEKEAYD